MRVRRTEDFQDDLSQFVLRWLAGSKKRSLSNFEITEPILDALGTFGRPGCALKQTDLIPDKGQFR